MNVITMRSMLATLALAAAATWANAAVGAPPPPGLLRVGGRAANNSAPVGPTAVSMEGAGPGGVRSMGRDGNDVHVFEGMAGKLKFR